MAVPPDDSVAPTESQAMRDWGEEAELMLKRNMHALGWGYTELAQALVPLGIKRSATVLNRKINRQNFKAGFFLACLTAMQVKIELRPDDAQGNERAQAKKARKI